MIARAEKQEVRLPKLFIWSVVAICLLPVTLNLFGIDFASESSNFDLDTIHNQSFSKSEQTDKIFYATAGSLEHALLEWSAVIIAIVTMILSFAHFSIQRDLTTPIIGIAMICSGFMDAFHALAATHLIDTMADNAHLMPFTWVLARGFNASVLIICALISIISIKKRGWQGKEVSFVIFISAIFVAIAYLLIYFSATSEILPQTQFPNAIITHPFDVLPLVLFLIAAPIFWLLYKHSPSLLTAGLILSILPEVALEVHMVFGSSKLFDNNFNIAHFLKIFAYAIPLVGLIFDYLHTYKRMEVAEGKITDYAGRLEKKQLELERKRKSDEYNLSYMNAILENAADGIITISSEGVITSFNKAAEKTFGYNSDEIKGKGVTTLIPSRFHKNHAGYLDIYKQTGKANIIGMSGRELSAIRKGEKEFPVEIAVTEIKTEKETFFTAFVRDITERKKAQEEIVLAKDVAERASRTKSEFLANMSHELRTPLNSLLILSEFLKDNIDGNLTEQQIGDAQVIHNSGNDLRILINDILDLSKVEAGMLEAYPENIKLIDIQQSIEENFTHVAKDTNLALKVNIEPDIPQNIYSDKQRIDQVLRNFLSNSFKFTHTGGVVVNISRPKADVVFNRDLEVENTISFAVTDTGIGIPSDKLEEVFEAFKQVDGSTTREYGGTGLGLSISRQFAALLGGEIQVESREKEGSTFTLYIPKRINAQNEGSERHVNTKQAIATAPNDDRESLCAGDIVVLVIEDDSNFAEVLKREVHRRGFKCLIAGDGRTGMSFARKYKPCAVILDIELPDINGMVVFERMNVDPNLAHIPVYFISIHDESREALAKGAIGYLTKPVSIKQLDDAIAKIEAVIISEIHAFLIIEDNLVISNVLVAMLKKKGFKPIAVETAEEGLEVLHNGKVECIILDLMLPGMSGLQMLETIEQDQDITLPPVIVYSGKNISNAEQKELDKYVECLVSKSNTTPEQMLDKIFENIDDIDKVQPLEEKSVIPEKTDCPAQTNSNLKDKEVLIVDDDMRNVFALSRVLKAEGMKVHIAKDGQQAVDFLCSHEKVDIVLMDIMMPVMDGYEAIAEIRKKEQFANVPIIAVTAKAMKEDKEKCISLGATDYLAKPVEPAKLLPLMGKLVRTV